MENIVRSLLSIVYIEEKTNAVWACRLFNLDFIGKNEDRRISNATLIPYVR